jgi:hypothetical protein
MKSNRPAAAFFARFAMYFVALSPVAVFYWWIFQNMPTEQQLSIWKVAVGFAAIIVCLSLYVTHRDRSLTSHGPPTSTPQS